VQNHGSADAARRNAVAFITFRTALLPREAPDGPKPAKLREDSFSEKPRCGFNPTVFPCQSWITAGAGTGRVDTYHVTLLQVPAFGLTNRTPLAPPASQILNQRSASAWG